MRNVRPSTWALASNGQDLANEDASVSYPVKTTLTMSSLKYIHMTISNETLSLVS